MGFGDENISVNTCPVRSVYGVVGVLRIVVLTSLNSPSFTTHRKF